MSPRGGARGLAMLLVGLVASSCTIEQRDDQPASRDGGVVGAPPHRQIIQPEGIARLPVFSTAVRTGDLLFLSGQIGTMPGVEAPTLVEGGVGPETRRTMENIQSVLTGEGLTLNDLVKCTVFLADIADYGPMNAVYVEFFPRDPPARSAMAGSGLALGARVEIECIAAYPAS